MGNEHAAVNCKWHYGIIACNLYIIKVKQLFMRAIKSYKFRESKICIDLNSYIVNVFSNAHNTHLPL